MDFLKIAAAVAEQRVARIQDRAQQREARQQLRRAQLAPELSFAEGTGLHGQPTWLVAEGDSWFDYPGSDVLAELEGVYGYEISSVAHYGHTLESMAYAPKQLDGLDRAMKKLADRGRMPKAVLLSAGGNDIAGDEFAVLLNHAASGLSVLNDDVVRGIVDVRLKAAFTSLILAIGGLCATHFGRRDLPVLVHGYGNAIPDGRGYLGGWGPLPGPWLEPGFLAKGYPQLAPNAEQIAILIQRFNDMLATLPALLPNVHVLDIRNELNSTVAGNAYQTDWDNELHPEDPGFERVADRFHEVLMTI